MNDKPNLYIYEEDYSVSPNGVNSFEVYDRRNISDPPIFESDDLMKAAQFCYNLGQDFTVHTLSQYYAEEALNV